MNSNTILFFILPSQQVNLAKSERCTTVYRTHLPYFIGPSPRECRKCFQIVEGENEPFLPVPKPWNEVG